MHVVSRRYVTVAVEVCVEDRAVFPVESPPCVGTTPHNPTFPAVDGDGRASSSRERPNVAPDVPFSTPGLGPASTLMSAMKEMHARRRWGQLCLRVCAVPDRGTSLEAARA